MLLPPLDFVLNLPSAAACPSFDLVAHHYFLPLSPPLPQLRQLLLLLSWLQARLLVPNHPNGLVVEGVQAELMALAVVGFLQLPSRVLGRPLASFSNRHLGRKEVGGEEGKEGW